MLSIRLSRIGKKKQPHYRIVVMEKTKDPWADYVEKLGHYNPKTKELVLDKERAGYWLSKGAEPTKAIHNMFVNEKLIEADKVPVSHITTKRQGKLESAKAAEKEAELAAEEAAKQAEEEAKAAAEEAKAAEAEAKTEEVKEEATEEKVEEVTKDATEESVEEATEEKTEEVTKDAVEEKVEEAPAEEVKVEEK